MAAVVSLPIYADFGHFAYWPATQPSVSKNMYCLKTNWWLLSSKVANKINKIRKLTCNMLLGDKLLWADLKFPSHCPSCHGNDADRSLPSGLSLCCLSSQHFSKCKPEILTISLNEIIHKVLPVTKYEGRPESFAYFEHCFHVFDIKVKHYTFILK